MKEKEKKNNIYYKQILLSLLLITLLVVAVISISFSVFFKAQNPDGYSTSSVGKITMTYTEDNNGISIQNALPTSDEVGMNQMGKGEYFDFTVTSTVAGDAKIVYEIVAVKDANSTIADKDIKLYLEKQENGTYVKTMNPTTFIPIKERTSVGTPKNAMLLKKVIKKTSGTDNYRLKMWLDEKAIAEPNKFYTVKVNVYGISD